jgi:hypothetical protein
MKLTIFEHIREEYSMSKNWAKEQGITWSGTVAGEQTDHLYFKMVRKVMNDHTLGSILERRQMIQRMWHSFIKSQFT